MKKKRKERWKEEGKKDGRKEERVDEKKGINYCHLLKMNRTLVKRRKKEGMNS